MTEPILRYFDCRSRGEALRFAFVDSGIAFRDERVPIAEFVKLRAEPERLAEMAPFAALPVLEWGSYVIAETLAIASYLGERLGHAPYLADAETRGVHNMIVSAAHLGMQAPYSQLFWRRADLREPALREAAQGLLDELIKTARQLERLCSDLEVETHLGGAAPAMSDFFVYESLDRAHACFGDAFSRRLESLPRLHALKRTLDERPPLADYRAANRISKQITASPTETALQARLDELTLA